MRIVFAGTPPFAALALEALVAAGHEIPLILTQPDRPAGRGLKLSASAVALAAERYRIPVAKPRSLKEPEIAARLRDAAPDVMVVAAYGLLLPEPILAIARRGCLNIHASLLPRWRGAAPVQRAILAGDATTGVSIMQMDAGLDTGPVLLSKPMAIEARATAGSLTQALAAMGATSIVEALARIDSLRPLAQDPALATAAPKISREEGRIDWRRAADEVDRLVRAFDPVPGAETTLGSETLKVWEARPETGEGVPGCVLRATRELVVACGRGALRIEKLQRAGGKRLPAADFLRGFPIAPGTRLGDAVRPLTPPVH